MKIGDFWIGWSDHFGYVIHDNTAPLHDDYVYLWVVARNGPERFNRAIAKTHLHAVPQERREDVISAVSTHLVKFAEFQTERSKNEQSERDRRKRAPREAWCWNCHVPVSSEADTKCNKCGWLTCGCCAACGCTYAKSQLTVAHESDDPVI